MAFALLDRWLLRDLFLLLLDSCLLGLLLVLGLAWRLLSNLSLGLLVHGLTLDRCLLLLLLLLHGVLVSFTSVGLSLLGC